jgi:hypothetical protein
VTIMICRNSIVIVYSFVVFCIDDRTHCFDTGVIFNAVMAAISKERDRDDKKLQFSPPFRVLLDRGQC